MRKQFSRYGIPEVLVSDNGPQYSSADFKAFATAFRFTHVTSSPTYPQSNGMAERAVQTTKRLLKKAKQAGVDPHLAMLELRNTPIGTNLGSPAQILMGRRTRTQLPTAPVLLKPKQTENVTEQLDANQAISKQYYCMTMGQSHYLCYRLETL